jgi:hypothetical protein
MGPVPLSQGWCHVTACTLPGVRVGMWPTATVRALHLPGLEQPACSTTG